MKKKKVVALTESVPTSVATTCLVIKKKWMEANINQRVFVRITMAT